MAGYSELKEGLMIEKAELDDEIVQQPSKFFDAGEMYVEAVAVRDTAKEELSQKDAELYEKHREEMEEADGKKPSDAAVKMAVERDPIHAKYTAAHLDAKLKADRLQILKESYSQRSYMLRDLATLYSANYFETTSMKGGRDVKGERNIEKLKEDRARRAREEPEHTPKKRTRL